MGERIVELNGFTYRRARYVEMSDSERATAYDTQGRWFLLEDGQRFEVFDTRVLRKLRRAERRIGKPKKHKHRRRDRNASALLRFFRRRGDNARAAAELARQEREREEQLHRRPDQRRGITGALAGFIRSFRRGGRHG